MSAELDEELLVSIESGQADRRILEFAARGFIPLPAGQLVRAVATISRMGDPELSTICEETFRGFDREALLEAVGSPNAKWEQLDTIAAWSDEPKVLEPLIRHRAVSDETLAWLAERVAPDLQDVLVTNQQRLLRSPQIVERLFENPQLSPDIRRRADEFLEEFFLKKIREEAREVMEDAVEAPEAALSAQVSAGAGGTAAESAGKAGSAAPSALPGEVSEEDNRSLFAKLAEMTVVQKIRLAFTGTREARLLLVRDRNRLVSTAVLKSPKTNEADAEAVANMKSVSEDVLRSVAMKREWMKKYSIVLAIVKNPRSPVDMTVPLVSRLQLRDQQVLAADKNIPEAVRVFARRAVARKQGGMG